MYFTLFGDPGGEPNATHRYPGMEARVNVASNTEHLVSIALQTEVNSVLVSSTTTSIP